MDNHIANVQIVTRGSEGVQNAHLSTITRSICVLGAEATPIHGDMDEGFDMIVNIKKHLG